MTILGKIDGTAENSRAASSTVSIGMPVYNGERYLRSSLEALLKQTFGDFELIISDNASEDNTQSISLEYAAQDKRIRYYRQPVNMPAARNFNWVYNQSIGKYFMWAAYDDLWAPDYIEACVKKLDHEQTAVLCMTDVQFIDQNGRFYASVVDGYETVGFDRRGRIREQLQHGGCFEIYGLMRSDVLSRTKLFGKLWYLDLCLLFELGLLGGFVRVPKRLFFYREFRNKRDIGLLRTMRSICDPETKAPRYPFTGIYLFTQVWGALNKMIFCLHESKPNTILLLIDVTWHYFHLWRLAIYREHKLKLYYFHDLHNPFGVMIAYCFCLLFKPACIMNHDLICIFVESLIGLRLFGMLRKLNVFFKSLNHLN
jgi:glycosyltransferase involved in cell wall biosynthesis